MAMTKEQLNAALYQKMYYEQEEYRSKLLALPPKEILEHAYAYTVREDILLSLEYNDLTGQQAMSLLKSEYPLADIFSKWEDHETGYMQDIFGMMETHAMIFCAKRKTFQTRMQGR